MTPKHFQHFILLLLMLFALTGQASGARSPEALAMQFVAAYRSGDVEAIVKLKYFDSQTGLLSEKMAREEARWQAVLRRYRMTGYRVVNLSGADRERLATLNQNKNERNLPLLPIKKW